MLSDNKVTEMGGQKGRFVAWLTRTFGHLFVPPIRLIDNDRLWVQHNFHQARGMVQDPLMNSPSSLRTLKGERSQQCQVPKSYGIHIQHCHVLA